MLVMMNIKIDRLQPRLASLLVSLARLQTKTPGGRRVNI